MLNEISDEALQKFFEAKTHLHLAEIIRVDDRATIALEDCNRQLYVFFKVTDNSCTASPKERLGNMAELWKAFLLEQKQTAAVQI